MSHHSCKLFFISTFNLIFAVQFAGCEKRLSPSRNVNSPASPAEMQEINSNEKDSKAQPITATIPVLRGLKLRHPEKGLLMEPPPTDTYQNRLSKELKGVTLNEDKYNEALQRLWIKYNLLAFDRILDSAKEERILSGIILPKEILSIVSWNPQRIGDVPFTILEIEVDAVRMLGCISGVSGVLGGNNLPNLLAIRANQLPPTVTDLAAYYAVSQGIEEMNPSTNRPYLEFWEPLTHAKNPIYRLLALEAGMRAISAKARDISTEDRLFSIVDAPAKVTFYLPFLSESDPVILKKALEAMGTVASSDAKSALQHFRDVQQQAGNTALVEAAEEAISACELMIATFRTDR